MPPVLMVPPELTTAQTGVIATTLPEASRPTAVNCCVPFCGMMIGAGVTLMVASAPTVPVVTVIVARPVIVPTVATTVLVYTPGVAPAVNNPVALIVPPPATTDHVGEMLTAAPFASVPVATICTVPEGASVALGVTVIVASAPVATELFGAVESFPHAL